MRQACDDAIRPISHGKRRPGTLLDFYCTFDFAATVPRHISDGARNFRGRMEFGAREAYKGDSRPALGKAATGGRYE